MFFVRVPLRNALVTHVSTQTRAGIGDLRARQSQEESLLHGLAKFRGLNLRAKAGESLVLTDGENCVQRISSELIAISVLKIPRHPPLFYTDMADDARETPPRLAVSDSRLLWERGVVLPPFEAAQTWAVDLAVDLAHGRVQLMPPVSVSNGRAVQLYQLLCDVKTRPASCRGLAFGHFLGCCRPCTSASRLLGRKIAVAHAGAAHYSIRRK